MLADWLTYQRWRAQFVAILDQRFYTPEWLDDEVRSGRARCWSNMNAAILATMKDYPTGAKEVHGLAAVGELQSIKHLVAEAELWGCANGAIVASISSRAGLVRAFAPAGYEPYQVTIRKEL